MTVDTTEMALIMAAKAGDGSAAAALYRRYFRLLYGYLYNQLGSALVAEDICQETFLRAFKGLGGFEGKASFKNWLFQITKNLLADHWKKQAKTGHFNFSDFYEVSDTSFAAYTETILDDTAMTTQATQQAEAVQKILNQLPPEYRQVLEHRFLRGYTLQETADALNISLSNSKVRQYRALQQAKTIANSLSLL